MDTNSVAYSGRSGMDVVRVFGLETKFEFLKLIRNRAFSL
jgi:hypothetical protein